MKIPQRILTVKITFPSEDSGEAGTVEISRANLLPILVKTSKNVLQIQNECQITILGLRPDIRQRLLTAFTAWNYRKAPTAHYATVEVFAGYVGDESGEQGSRVFVGDVAKCTISGELPNYEINITAYTRQRDRTNLAPGSIPSRGTFKKIVEAVGKAAAMSVDCQTSFDAINIDNFGIFQVNPTGEPYRFSVQAAIVGLSGLAPDSVAIWVDDDKIIARDMTAAIEGDVPKVSVFVGQPPSWTEWGVTFSTLFTPRLRLGGACEIDDPVNPKINGQYVITRLEYDLSSRDRSFYVTVQATPPAAQKEA